MSKKTTGKAAPKKAAAKEAKPATKTLGDRVEKVATSEKDRVRELLEKKPAAKKVPPHRAIKEMGKAAAAEGRAEGRRMVDAANATGRPDQIKKAPKAAQPAKEGMSGLEAAALVLKEAKAPMGAKEIVAAIQDRKLAPKLRGATPHATIYAAMITEIAKKGAESRFARATEKGKFTAA